MNKIYTDYTVVTKTTMGELEQFMHKYIASVNDDNIEPDDPDAKPLWFVEFGNLATTVDTENLYYSQPVYTYMLNE